MSVAGWPRLIAAGVAGYAAGLIPSADVASRLASGGRVDLRAHGSGNPGGANAAAVLGRRWGYTVMAADIAKGAAAARIGRRLAGDSGQHVAAVAGGPWKQRAFTATAASSLIWVGAATLWWRRGWPNGWGGPATAALPLAAAASSAVIFQRFWAGRPRSSVMLR